MKKLAMVLCLFLMLAEINTAHGFGFFRPRAQNNVTINGGGFSSVAVSQSSGGGFFRGRARNNVTINAAPAVAFSQMRSYHAVSVSRQSFRVASPVVYEAPAVAVQQEVRTFTVQPPPVTYQETRTITPVSAPPPVALPVDDCPPQRSFGFRRGGY